MRRVPTVGAALIHEILVDSAITVVILLITQLGVGGAFSQAAVAAHLPAWTTCTIRRADSAS
jgi:hypothetical protein